ncbi:hypothetical protein CRG98_002945 [Punica granatum]|uniref:Uncharacterized protein n=1 Tax=Punica granatum TaxID=22663 RepID=A0A2I0L933_PUNGR|nr:hypothetical protein CRG98_002945 [Punica granatum]
MLSQEVTYRPQLGVDGVPEDNTDSGPLSPPTSSKEGRRRQLPISGGRQERAQAWPHGDGTDEQQRLLDSGRVRARGSGIRLWLGGGGKGIIREIGASEGGDRELEILAMCLLSPVSFFEPRFFFLKALNLVPYNSQGIILFVDPFVGKTTTFDDLRWLFSLTIKRVFILADLNRHLGTFTCRAGQHGHISLHGGSYQACQKFVSSKMFRKSSPADTHGSSVVRHTKIQSQGRERQNHQPSSPV